MAREAIKPSNPPPPRSLVFPVSRMNVSEKRQLRKKLEIELAQVRSTMKRLEYAESSKMITSTTTTVVPLDSVKNDQSCRSLGLEENRRRIIVENSTGIKTCPKKKMLNSDVGVSTSLPKKGTTRILGYVDTTEIKSSSKKVVRSCSIEEPKLGKCSSSVIKSTPESMVTHATTDQGFPQGFLKGQDKKKQITDKCRVIEDPEVNSYLKSSGVAAFHKGSCKRPSNLLGDAETNKIKPGQRGYFESIVKSYYSCQKSSSVPSKRGAPTDEFVVSGADDCRLFHLPKKQKLESKSILDDSTSGKNKLCPSSAKPSMRDLIERANQKLAESKRREDSSIQQPCMSSKTEVVEAAPCKSSKISSKMQLEMQRQAARIALEKVVKPVDIYGSPDIINEVEWLARACMKINPLKRLGLTLKDCRRISC